jgi:hypothetical protein
VCNFLVILIYSRYPKRICERKRDLIVRSMSIKEFIEDVFEENREELERIRRLSKILDQLRDEKTEVYVFSVTSNL